MRIDQTAILYPAAPGTPITPLSPPPSVGGPQAMDGDCHPAVDMLPTRSYRDYIHLYMLRNDLTGSMAVINGMDLGFYVKQVQCFTMYGAHAPRLTVHPLSIDDGTRISSFVPDALPHRSTAVLITVSTDQQTEPGKYRTNLEIQGEASVFYMPVVIDVADAQALPVEIVPLTEPAADPLDILFSAAGQAPFGFYEGEDYAGVLYRLALHHRMLYHTARQTDPLLTDMLVNSLARVTDHHEDDAALLQRVRRALVYRLDSQFEGGNREPSVPKGGVIV